MDPATAVNQYTTKPGTEGRTAYALAVALVISVWGIAFVGAVFGAVRQAPAIVDPNPALQALKASVYAFAGVVVPWFLVGPVGLGLDRQNRSQWTVRGSLVACGLAFYAMAIGAAVMAFLIKVVDVPGPAYEPHYEVAGLLLSGFHEEPVTVAVIGLLVAGRRPVWEILTFVVTARVLFHAHLGFAAIGNVALWATAFAYLWFKYRNLPALILAHTLVNAIVLIGPALGINATH